ncbi:hypothetical protein AJ80_00689 [Polytolypa hystricis UAMH7299]|uniref:Exosome complex component CSL4 C-terminal domain-containing protein n=1 Tax=Polytolypa hystricis (strain UAMH7299) TaxID=1447883 RepID=A0A2B7YUD9_POLH7|nr:hypothetical protein AJ80_00689 [Polytolypa hystricis UAMH7299]
MAAPIPSIAVPGQRLGPATSYLPGPGTHVQDSFICASIAGPVIVKENTAEPKRKPQQQQQQQQQQQRATLTVARSHTQTLPDINAAKPNPSAPTTTTTAPAPATKKPPAVKYNTLPAVDSIVLARVTRVQKRQATLTILVVLDESQHHSLDTSDMASLLASAPPLLTNSTTNADNNNADELRFQALIRKEDVRAVEKDRVVMDEMFRVGDIVRASVISIGDQSFYYATTARNELGVVLARSEAGNMMFPVSWREMRDAVTGVAELRKVARPF